MENKVHKLGNVGGVDTQGRSVFLASGISPTLTAGMIKGNTVPYIIEIEKVNRNERDKR